MSKKNDFLKRIRARIIEKMKDKPFNSADMYQIPFEFFSEHDDNYEIDDVEDRSRKAFAKKYFDMRCGYLHLGWNIDTYWTMVANKIMVPHVIAIYNELVRLGHDEKNPCMYGDADGDVFWIPAKNPKTKVLVHTNQTIDYVYILTEIKSKRKNNLINYDFHIRRIWRNWDYLSEYQRGDLERLYDDVTNNSNRSLKGKKNLESMNRDKFIKTILENIDQYEEISDDHSKHSRRHSLEYYRSHGFDMGPNYDKPFNGIFGDFRDGGFVMSIKSDDYGTHRAERCSEQFHVLELITTCYLPSIVCQLNLCVENEWINNNE